MAIVLLLISIIGLVLIATESVNRINKAAVAMFVGVLCWLLYIVYGRGFVNNEHAAEFQHFLSLQTHSDGGVKDFIAGDLFFQYVVQCAGIVFFLIATTSIVEVLHNNGCFDFLSEWLRTRRPRKLLWTLAAFTFLISANLDNMVTVVLMLSVLHPMLSLERDRRVYGTVVVLSANAGGAISVIGDVTSLKLWNEGLITPSSYFLTLVLPILAALSVMLLLLMRKLPSRIEMPQTALPYRGDDTLLTRNQRLLLFFVGIGGLWFIPSFHRITHLPPFVGALCVLALLWMVNELCNRQLLGSDRMSLRRLPVALQYANLQNILYFIGLTLMFGALAESGLFEQAYVWIGAKLPNVYIIGGLLTAVSALFGTIPTLLGSVEFFDQSTISSLTPLLGTDGAFWPMLSYVTAMGGSMLLTGSMAGVLLMRMENMTFRWYFSHIFPKVLAGAVVGFAVLALIMQGIIYLN